jgi:hypothetical protein
VSAGFDWKPLLSEGETLLWEGRASHLRLLAFGAVFTAVAVAAWLMAGGEVAQAPGGADCLSADCPTADRKAGFVVYFAGPVSILMGACLLLWSALTRQFSAVTTNRALAVSRRLWRKQPTLRQVPVKGASAMLNAAPLVTLGLFVRSPHANQRILLWGKSRAELKKAQSLIEELSSGIIPVQGRTP